MKKLFLTAAIFLAALGAVLPQQAEARVFVSARFGGGYYPYPYYSPYYYPYYVAPPPVVYAVPPGPPVIYAEPAPVYAEAPAPIYAPTVPANQTSPTFIDSAGRTCRHFQSTGGGPAYGTACLMPDGTWHSVP